MPLQPTSLNSGIPCTIVPSLEAKQIRGRTYYYLVWVARVNGRPRKVRTVYLGTAATLAERLEERRPRAGPLRLKSYPFGRAALLVRTARQLDLVATIDHYAHKRSTPGLTIGQYLLLTILARAYEPWSKAATGRWFERDCYLRFLWTVSHRVASDTILANLRRLADPAVQKRIEHALAQRLVREGLRPSLLLWDLTNWSNYIEEGEELPQAGYAKNRRYDLNLVGTGLVVTEEHLPLLHETVPGNADESEVFARAVESLVVRLTRLELDPREMILVFDRGPNSNDNVAKALDLMHVVGAVPPQLVPDLMALDLDQFSPLGPTASGHPLLAYRTRRELYDQELTVVVTYNAATAERKRLTYERYEQRFLERMARLKKNWERTQGRPLSYESAAAQAAALVFDPYRSVFHYRIEEKPRALTYEVDAAAKQRLLTRFGRRAYFTDLEMDAEWIVRTYEERTRIEEDFRWMKGDEMMPFAPLFVRKDESIRAHAFLVVMGLLLWRLAFREVRSKGITAGEGEILEALDELRVALVADQSRGPIRSGRWQLEEHGRLAEKLYRKLDLEAEAPK